MDRISCTYTGNKDVTFFIAGDSVGMQSLSGGASGYGYVTKASSGYVERGRPIVQARIARYTPTGGALWTLRSSIVVPANGSITHTFGC